MLQNDRPKLIQGFILGLGTSNALQDESCAPTHANRSAAFMLQNDRPKLIQGFILGLATSHTLQDQYKSCAPVPGCRRIHAHQIPIAEFAPRCHIRHR
jgi:hypothetical protein